MPREEVRVRLTAARKMYPMIQIAKLMKMTTLDLMNFEQGKPPRHMHDLGPMRLKRLAKICLDIETGVLRHNGEWKGKSKVSVGEATKAPTVIHRVLFEKSGPSLLKGKTLDTQKMPSFAKLFAEKPALLLPKQFKSR